MLKQFYKQRQIEAGCDEVGRGCLAGPVVAAAVVLPTEYKNRRLNDSKQLSEDLRYDLKSDIVEKAISWAIGLASPDEIDEINILNASYLAMQRAIDNLQITPEFLLIDGNRYKPHNDIPYQCIIKGDGKYLSIAAASVLAKCYRDDLMRQLAIEFSGYGWETNVGYPTIQHRTGIKKLGITKHHRRSFQLLPALS